MHWYIMGHSWLSSSSKTTDAASLLEQYACHGEGPDFVKLDGIFPRTVLNDVTKFFPPCYNFFTSGRFEETASRYYRTGSRTEKLEDPVEI
jgi:hypothetical protein